MKIVIDLDDKLVSRIKQDRKLPSDERRMINAVLTSKSFNSKTTNGDMILELYPGSDWRYDHTIDRVFVEPEDINFSAKWWNAPYKEN